MPPKVIEVPIPGIDKSKPDLSDYDLRMIVGGLVIPNYQSAWLMARELKQWRSGDSAALLDSHRELWEALEIMQATMICQGYKKHRKIVDAALSNAARKKQGMSEVSREQRYFDALKRIAGYETPAQLLRSSERDYGLPYEEALQCAYENIQQEAKAAIKGQIRPTGE